MTPTWLLSIDNHWSRQITIKVDKILELSASTAVFISWKLQYFIYFHCDLFTPAMSTDSKSGRCRSLFFFLTYFLSFYLSRFSFYINIIETHLCYVYFNYIIRYLQIFVPSCLFIRRQDGADAAEDTCLSSSLL